MTPSSDSTHSLVSSGSMSGSWLGRPAVITVQPGSRRPVGDIAAEAERFVADQGDGLLHVFVPHATAGLAIIETGSGSDDDLLRAIDDLLPTDDKWRHRHGSRGHGRDHGLPAWIPPYATLPVVDGRIA